jgi:hypothetical protein
MTILNIVKPSSVCPAKQGTCYVKMLVAIMDVTTTGIAREVYYKLWLFKQSLPGMESVEGRAV